MKYCSLWYWHSASQSLRVSLIEKTFELRHADGQAVASIAIATLNEREPGRSSARDKCDDLLLQLADDMSTSNRGPWEVSRISNEAPRLLVSGQPSGLSASVSHSGRWVAAAVASGSAVGIDVETHRTRARRREITNFLRLSEMADNDDARFYACWTLREAIAKATNGSVLEPHASEVLLGAACETPNRAVSAGPLTAIIDKIADAHLAVVLHQTTELA